MGIINSILQMILLSDLGDASDNNIEVLYCSIILTIYQLGIKYNYISPR